MVSLLVMHSMATGDQYRERGRISRSEGLRYDSAMRSVFRPLLMVSLMMLASIAFAVESEATAPMPADVVENAGAAARQAVDMTGGRVLDVQKRFFGERAMYVVKVLLGDGRVKVVEVEANPTSGPDFMER